MQASSIQYPITVQAIRSKGCNPRLYVYVPLPLAAAINLEPGERVQWTLLDRGTLQMKRADNAACAAAAKNHPSLAAKKATAHEIKKADRSGVRVFQRNRSMRRVPGRTRSLSTTR